MGFVLPLNVLAFRSTAHAVFASEIGQVTTPRQAHATDAIERVRTSRADAPAQRDAVCARILETTADLVSIPSQGGIDDPRPICEALIAKLAAVGIGGRMLMQGARPVGVVAEVVGEHPGPTYCLNAVVDTAPVGDANSWSTVTPFSAELRGNRLVGRGVGDSKVAAAMFIEVGRELAQRTSDMHGRAVLFFDAAEHAGNFEGMKAFIDAFGTGPARVQGMVIGYPGNKSLQVGSRGFHRTQWRMSLETLGSLSEVQALLRSTLDLPLPEGRSLEFPLPTKRSVTAVRCETGGPAGPGTVVSVALSGKADHSGASARSGVNAIEKAELFMHALELKGRTLFGDAFAPALTRLDGGQDFSVIPDQVRLDVFVPEGIPKASCEHLARLAAETADELMPAPVRSELKSSAPADADTRFVSALTLNVDVRTTVVFDIDAVDALVQQRVAALRGRGVQCSVATAGAWPAYKLPEGSPLSTAMQTAINAHAKKPGQPRISGPSNAGNVAAAFGIPATAGFGVSCKAAHAADESIDISTIPVAYAVHVEAMESLFRIRAPARDARG